MVLNWKKISVMLGVGIKENPSSPSNNPLTLNNNKTIPNSSLQLCQNFRKNPQRKEKQRKKNPSMEKLWKKGKNCKKKEKTVKRWKLKNIEKKGKWKTTVKKGWCGMEEAVKQCEAGNCGWDCKLMVLYSTPWQRVRSTATTATTSKQI